MRIAPLLVLLFLAAAYGQQTSVAVLPSDGTALNNDELEALTDKMRLAALNVLPTDAFVLLKQDVVIKRLGGMEKYIKECTESSCIVDLGVKANVDYVSQASVGKLGNKIRLKVELYNVRTGGLVGMLSDEESENVKDLLSIVEKRVPAEVFGKILNISVGSKATSEAQTPSRQELDEFRKWKELEGSENTGGGVSDGSFTDSRDGKKYEAVKIGKQTWMAENLNYNASGSKCYGEGGMVRNTETRKYITLSNAEIIKANCTQYGRLYDWTTAETACPKGWHLPSDNEWDVLMASVGGAKKAGKYLKAAIGWNDNKGKSGNGEDKFGFVALPSGYGNSGGSFDGVGTQGIWWSAERFTAYYARSWSMYYSSEYVNRSYYNKDNNLFSVRCVKD